MTVRAEQVREEAEGTTAVVIVGMAVRMVMVMKVVVAVGMVVVATTIVIVGRTVVVRVPVHPSPCLENRAYRIGAVPPQRPGAVSR